MFICLHTKQYSSVVFDILSNFVTINELSSSLSFFITPEACSIAAFGIFSIYCAFA